MKNILFTLSVLLFLSACGESKTVEWYLEHPAEHKAQLEKCANDPAKLAQTAACTNAKAAASKKAMGYGKFKP